MTEKQPTRRRQVYIKKQFQFRFILKFCMILLAGVLVSTALLFLFSQDTLTSSFSHSRLEIKSTGEAMLPAIIYTNLISLALILVTTIMVTLYISHKIAGPIFRLESEIRRIGEGNLSTTVTLRNKDQMLEFAQRVNEMTSGLHRRVSEVQRQVDEIAAAASQPDSTETVSRRADRLRQYIRDHFTL
jgi:methyl-accepting chemotaxis protein